MKCNYINKININIFLLKLDCVLAKFKKKLKTAHNKIKKQTLMLINIVID